MKKIALLATGDEITNGDILNTNAQKIAQSLFELGIPIGMHIVVSDYQVDIEKAMNFLLQHHAGLITIGGLGPTSDDRTRFALAKATERELIFDDDTWAQILERFKRFNLINQPDSNKQQALFPEGATILPNPNGTACGCFLPHQDKLIFMLPGPPSECLPMFAQSVLPILAQTNLAEHSIFKRWLLFGVSEGEIAAQLDALAHPLNIETGYRIRYPYVEFKIRAQQLDDLLSFEQAASSFLLLSQINEENLPASEILAKHLETANQVLEICDLATRGYLQKALVNHKNHHQLHFVTAKSGTQEDIVYIEGLQDIWQSNAISSSELVLRYKRQELKFTIPFRRERTPLYAVELIAQQLLKLI